MSLEKGWKVNMATNPEGEWETFVNHDGNITLTVYDKNILNIFDKMGRAVTALVTNPRDVHVLYQRILKVKGSSLDDLLHDFVLELVLFYQEQGLIFGLFNTVFCVHGAASPYLEVACGGETLSSKKHPRRRDLKDVTYKGLEMEYKNNIWKASVRVVVDTVFNSIRRARRE